MQPQSPDDFGAPTPMGSGMPPDSPDAQAPPEDPQIELLMKIFKAITDIKDALGLGDDHGGPPDNEGPGDDMSQDG